MNSKTMAVIAVVIVVIIGGAAAFLLLGQSGPKNPVDIVCTEPEVGDSIEVSTVMTMTSTVDSVSEHDILVTAFYPDVSEMTYAGDEVLILNDVDYECAVYVDEELIETEYVIIKESGFMLRMSVIGFTYVVKDTNMDPLKKIDEASISLGCYTLQSIEIGDLEGMTLTVVDGYDEVTETFTYSITTSLAITLDAEIASIEDGVITLTDGNTMTVSEYLSYVDYESMLAFYEEVGYTIEFGEKRNEILDTPFGARDVTIQAIKITLEDVEQEYEAYYGAHGALYMLCTSDESGDVVITLLSTTLFTTAEE